MWRLTLALLALGCSSVFGADEIKVSTWNLHWFPSGSKKGYAPAEVEKKRVSEAASVLKNEKPDIIVLEEVRDFESCDALAKEIGPEYQVVVCAAFRNNFGGGSGLQQVAILSKYPAQSAWYEEWKNFGIVDPPRGFAFAHFNINGKDIAVYGVHFKSNFTKGPQFKDRQLNILKRELASEQLLAHQLGLSKKLKEEFEATIVAGDFNTTKDQLEFASEKTLDIFEENGFLSGFESLPLAKRVTIEGKGRYPDATFDYIFAKGFKNNSDQPKILINPASDHGLVTRVLKL
jgi:endonuclease/exonuclease/phosphatase family metal-dependent hydrolase